MVQTSHSSEAGGWEVWSVSLADESVRVGGVADHNGLGVTSAVVVDGLADIDEDGAVVLEQIATLHTWSTGLGTDEEVVVDVLECGGEVASDHNIVEEGEGAIMQLSLNTFKDLLLEGQVEQVKDNSLVLAKELATIISNKIG